MSWPATRPLIVYLSPAGTTEENGELIAQALRNEGKEPEKFDLAEVDSNHDIYDRLEQLDEQALLFVGSPVYVGHALPQVMDFLDNLPEASGPRAVPYAVWGGVCSGIALREMASSLTAQNYRIAGAASLLGEHSQMWFTDSALAEGRPQVEEAGLAAELVEKLRSSISENLEEELALHRLEYLPEEVIAEYRETSLAEVKAHLPERVVHTEKCTECGICFEACPVDALELKPYPEFLEHCIYCYNCVRLCPEAALEVPSEQIAQMLREKATESPEPRESRVFLPD